MPDSASTLPASRRATTRALSGIAIAGLVCGASLLAAAPASAADIPDAIRDITVTNDDQTTPLNRYDELAVGANWAVPDNSAPGDTFSMTLPAQLAGISTTFPLQDAGGATFGSCTVAATRVDCTLSELVATRPLNVAGTLFFSGRFTDQIERGTTNVLAFDTGNNVENVSVDVAAGVPFTGNGFSKSGSVGADGQVTWYVNLPQAVDGLEQDLTDVVITDELDPFLAFVGPERVRLETGTSLNQAGTAPLFDQEVDRAGYTVALSGQTATVTIPQLAAGSFYRVVIDTVRLDGATGPFTNQATLSATELTDVGTASATVQFAAGGTGAGNGGGVSPAGPATPAPVGSAVNGVAVKGTVAADSADRLPATGAPTEGAFALAGLALLSVLAGTALTRMRRPVSAR